MAGSISGISSAAQPLNNYNVQGFNPKGLNVITTGVSITRPPRANVFIGYTVINTGPHPDLGLEHVALLLAEPEMVRHRTRTRTTSATRSC